MNMHKNAKLTPLGRERMVKMMLDGHTPARAAAGVSPPARPGSGWCVRLQGCTPASMQASLRWNDGSWVPACAGITD